MSDKQFLNGIKAFKPNDKAPDFVIANLVINKQELLEFLKSQPDSVKADIKKSQKGSLYIELNTWQPQQRQEQQAPVRQMQAPVIREPQQADIVDDLPF